MTMMTTNTTMTTLDPHAARTRRTAALLPALLALTALMSQSACARQDAAPAFSPAAVPAAHARYQAKLFDLTDSGAARYDAAFTKQYRALLAPQVKQDAKFVRRMTSGPTADGAWFGAGARGYLTYAICQAHACDSSAMVIAYDPAAGKMAGKVIDNCKQQWLGQPDAAEKALLEQRMKASYQAALDACAESK